MNLPAERTLPNKQLVLDRVLADDRPAQRPAWLVPVAAAAAVSMIAGGIALGPRLAGGTSPAPASSPSATDRAAKTPAERSIDLDLGPIPAARAAELGRSCLAFAVGGGTGTVSHAVRVRSWGRKKSQEIVAVLDPRDGLLFGCETHTAASPGQIEVSATVVGGNPATAKKSKIVINPTDSTHPAVPTEGNSSAAFIEFDDKPDLLVREAWYRVDERVDRMRQRFVVKGRPGPWYVAEASDGLVFLRSWDESAALRKGDAVRIETHVIDRQGNLLDAPADQLGGGGLTPSPGTTRTETGTVQETNGHGTISYTPR
jgi:hypothetical protein